MLRSLAPAFVPTLLLLAACSGKSADDTAADTDSGMVDSGGETGDTAPADPVYTDLVGTINYFEAVGGQTVCDVDIELTTTPYTGDCYDCAFAFNVDATITRDDSSADCSMVAPLSYIIPQGSGYHDLFMGLWKEYDAGGGYIFQNVLFTGYSYEYAGYDYPGPYYYFMGYGGGALGRTTFRDDALNLDWYYYAPPYLSYVGPYYDTCRLDEVPASLETQNRGGDAHQGRISCDQTTGDVWAVEVPDGANLSLAVDTISADSTFSPLMILNDPSGCSIQLAKDNFLCEYPPPSYLCPSIYQTGMTGGTYEVIVLNQHTCTSGSGDYVLEVSGASDVQLVSDDFPAFQQVSEAFLRTVQMNATLTEQ
jgi:hypothetical protein